MECDNRQYCMCKDPIFVKYRLFKCLQTRKVVKLHMELSSTNAFFMCSTVYAHMGYDAKIDNLRS